MDENRTIDEREQPPRGMPIDLTKEEFIGYQLTVDKHFGTMRMQKPTMILFAIYLIVTIIFLVMTYVNDHIIDWLMLLVMLLTLLGAVLTVTMIPSRMKKRAAMLYDAGDINGYYGELLVDRVSVTKLVGEEEDVVMPLNEKTAFIESKDFMAFFTFGGTKAIILPARCITKEAAASVREAVFAQNCRVVKRVIGRMEPLAQTPIERRDLLTKPQTLFSASMQFNEKEIKDQVSDNSWKRYVQQLPLLIVSGLLIGALMTILQESILWLGVATLAVVIGTLLLSTLNAHARAKQIINNPQGARIRFEMNGRGISAYMGTVAQPLFIRWQAVEYAVEHPDYVEFYGLKQIIRVPKRAIDDFEEFRRIVDTYHTPKKNHNRT